MTVLHERLRACARISSRISDHHASRCACGLREALNSLTLRAETTPAMRTTMDGGVSIVSSATWWVRVGPW